MNEPFIIQCSNAVWNHHININNARSAKISHTSSSIKKTLSPLFVICKIRQHLIFKQLNCSLVTLTYLADEHSPVVLIVGLMTKISRSLCRIQI